MFGGPVLRPYPGQDPSTRLARWVDTLGPDSPYDYDPVWAALRRARRRRRRSTPPRRAGGAGRRPRATSGTTSACSRPRARRWRARCSSPAFPTGSPSCGSRSSRAVSPGRPASTPTCSGTGRSATGSAVELYNPDHLDRARLVELFEQFGSDRYRARLDQLDDGLTFLSLPDEDPDTLDEFAACGIERRRGHPRRVHAAVPLRLRGRRPADRARVRHRAQPARRAVQGAVRVRHRALGRPRRRARCCPRRGSWSSTATRPRPTSASLTFENPVSLWAGMNPDVLRRHDRRGGRRAGARAGHAVAAPDRCSAGGRVGFTRRRSAAARGRSRPRSSGTTRRSRGRGGAGSPPSSGSRSPPR